MKRVSKQLLSGFTFFYLIICFITSSAYSQPADLHFEHLNEQNGLSSNLVTRIIQDREGFMWFGTDYGLNKYDGYNFTVFKHDPNNLTHSIQGSGERAFLEDKEGNLWVGTWGGGGINKVDKRTGNIKPYEIQMRYGELLNLHADRHGIIWIATGRGMVQFNPKTEEFIFYRNTISPISVVIEDAADRLWAFGGRDIFQFDRSNGKYTLFSQSFLPRSSSFAFTSVHLDEEGVLWIGTNGNGLFTLNTKKSPPQLTPYNNRLVNQTISENGIYEDSDGVIWLATRDGLQSINRKTNEVVTYLSNPSVPGTLSSNNIRCAYKDREGTLWVGTENGINKAIAKPKPFHTYQVRITPSNVRLPENKVETILEDHTGIVWLGNQQKGLYQFNPQSGQIIHIDANPDNATSLSSEGIRCIYEDHSGRLWVSTKEALHLLNSATGKFARYPTKFPVIAMDEDRGGKLWIACRFSPRQGAIAYFDSATYQFRYYYHSKSDTGLNGANISNIMVSRTGEVWVATYGFGLNRLNPKTGKFNYYTTGNPFTAGNLNDNMCSALYEDSLGFIWVATGKSGLNRFDPKTNKFSYSTTREGLPSNRVASIIKDAMGYLWLGTNWGISRFNPITKTFRNYDVSDGLPDYSFYSGSVYNRNGNLLFGSPNGFVIFHPDSLTDNTTPPPVYITGFKVVEQTRAIPTGLLALQYDENFLSFEFVALNYNSPEKNQYAYMLEGLDKDWIYSNTRRYASYTNLPQGNYTFRVKASNNDGIWNEKGNSLSIVIHPPWWHTWWAFAFYGLCFIAAVFAVHRYQRQRVIQQERERAREKELAQAKEIEKAYKELRSTQSQLIQSEKMASLGALTAGIAHEIQNPLNFVNNFSEINTELIDDLKSELLSDNKEEAISIADDIKENEQKINQHGKRADAIVKGMLQHSRVNKGKKEPTDINALADEFLRLSYHGLRAKDKDFNADFKTDFDESIGKIEVVPQDIGRVLLNLYNNAFYAAPLPPEGGFKDPFYKHEPTVWVTTSKIPPSEGGGAWVSISVRDNGPGISEKIIDKIYQPFFTTKPTGQGTGLGLSLSYDIVKAHGGELKVDTREEEGAEFIILLPAI